MLKNGVNRHKSKPNHVILVQSNLFFQTSRLDNAFDNLIEIVHVEVKLDLYVTQFNIFALLNIDQLHA